MRQTYRIADKCIFTVPLENVGWLPKNPTRGASIPVCANLPSSDMRAEAPASGTKKMRVAVYAVTAGNEWEVEQVRYAMSEAKKHFEELELVMIGRGTEVYGSAYVQALRGSGVKVNVRGILPVQEVIRELCASDAQLFPRGGLASRRGGALAGIACGLPIVGYAGPGDRVSAHRGRARNRAGVRHPIVGRSAGASSHRRCASSPNCGSAAAGRTRNIFRPARSRSKFKRH